MKSIQSILFSIVLLFLSSLALSTPAWAAEVNINQADAATLAAELRGIGEAKARAIVEYRKLNGPFRSVDDLQKVKGISIKTIEKNRQKLSL